MDDFRVLNAVESQNLKDADDQSFFVASSFFIFFWPNNLVNW